MGQFARAAWLSVPLFVAVANLSSAVCVAPVATRPLGGAIAVDVCFPAVGCSPHNPQVTIVGQAIRVTYTQAELPDCLCVIPTFEFTGTVLVSPLAPGEYTVSVFVINCIDERFIGTAEGDVAALPNVPTLGNLAMVGFILVLATVSLWRLRT